ncbi:TOBE domain-containing protein [Pasteurella langaaensis]|nr:TOBE domain-containing protein [Pasteurella langaaensis]
MQNNTEILLTIKLQEQLFVDPKRVRLLKEIQQCGSINQAAKNANVSYKSAWDHLAAMNDISPLPLLERNIGGKNGGGTKLTSYAERLLQLYDLLEQIQEKAFNILKDESVPLDSLLSATAKFALQSSARNQFFGSVISTQQEGINCLVHIQIDGLPQPLTASITASSAVRLGLVSGRETMLMIKAPWVEIYNTEPAVSHNLFQAQVRSVSDNDENKEVILAIGDIEFCATVNKTQNILANSTVWLHIEPEQIVLATL